MPSAGCRWRELASQQQGSNVPVQIFADDTNALVANKESSLKEFRECLGCFCLGSGSAINHSKTGIKGFKKDLPNWILEQGCKVIKDGEIFRLLGIPIGFKVSLSQKWHWVLDRLEGKMNRWINLNLSLSRRILILNHFIVLATLYFLSYWRPPEADLKKLHQICTKFMWSGASVDHKIPNAKWEVCILSKSKGGLGILDICNMVDRLAGKWMARSIISPNQDWWAILIHRNFHKAKLLGHTINGSTFPLLH